MSPLGPTRRVPAVYHSETYRHDGDPCCRDETGLHLKERTNAEVEGRWGADNGMFYWRARVVRVAGGGVPAGRWSQWRPHEPGSVVTQEELYWDVDHPSGPVYPDRPGAAELGDEGDVITCWYCESEGTDPAWFAWWTDAGIGGEGWLCGDCWNHVSIQDLAKKWRSRARSSPSAFASYANLPLWVGQLHAGGGFITSEGSSMDQIRRRVMDVPLSREGIMSVLRNITS